MRSQIWPRRQEMPQQRVLAGPTLIEGVERTDAMMIRLQQRAGFVQCNPQAMDIDRRVNQNCYSCGEFRYLAWNCKNRGMGNRIKENRKLEYRESGQKNLNGNGDLIAPNYISKVVTSLLYQLEQQKIKEHITVTIGEC